MRFSKPKVTVAGFTVALIGLTAVVAVSQEKKPAGPDAPPKAAIKEPFETAFPDVKPYTGKAGECPRFNGKMPVRPDPNDLLHRVAQARLTELVGCSKVQMTVIEGGSWNVSDLFNTIQVLRDIPAAAADVFGPTDELVRWYEEWVAMTKGIEDVLQKRLAGGNARRQEVHQMRAERFHAERELLKVMARVKAGGAK